MRPLLVTLWLDDLKRTTYFTSLFYLFGDVIDVELITKEEGYLFTDVKSKNETPRANVAK